MRRVWSGLAWLASTLVLLAIVALGGLGGALYWDRVDVHAQQATRDAIAPLAAAQIPKVFGYDYQTVERSLAEASGMLTPSYRAEFEEQMSKSIIPEARQRQVVAQATVVGVGVLEAQRDSGSVMVFMNQTLTDKSKEPLYQGTRLKVDYQKLGGNWLINYIAPI